MVAHLDTHQTMIESAGKASRSGWRAFLWFPLLLSLALLVLPQAAFIWMSFHSDIGMGAISAELTLANYFTLVTDPFYLEVIWKTIFLSGISTVISLFFAFPTAYILTRVRQWVATTFLSLVLATSLITISIKLLGLNLMLGSVGVVNRTLQYIGLIDTPLRLVNNDIGVIIGLVQYTLPISILMLFGVIQTIPVALEEAAESLGAKRYAIFASVLVPISKHGLVGSALIAFNMGMGAFTSPLILGGGRVLTLPILIQQKIILDTNYGFGAALAMLLLFLTLLINVIVGTYFLQRNRQAEQY